MVLQWIEGSMTRRWRQAQLPQPGCSRSADEGLRSSAWRVVPRLGYLRPQERSHTQMVTRMLFWTERKTNKDREWLNRTVKIEPDLGDAWAYYYKFELLHGSERKERLARQVFDYLAATCMRKNWTNRIYRLEKKYGFFTAPIQADTWQEYVKDVRNRVQEKEEELWLQGMGGKSSMALYGQHKRTIGAVFIYDNSLGSNLLFEARAGVLRTLERQRTIDSEQRDVLCRVCECADETMERIVVQCKEIEPQCRRDTLLHFALGFEGDGGEMNRGAVERTKRRLKRWRTLSLQKVAK
ncbi:hypothetical protein MTO96_026761 [Rhipicephalus appendiculatus]